MSNVTIHAETGAVSINLTKEEAIALHTSMGLDSASARRERGVNVKDSMLVYEIFCDLDNAIWASRTDD